MYTSEYFNLHRSFFGSVSNWFRLMFYSITLAAYWVALLNVTLCSYSYFSIFYATQKRRQVSLFLPYPTVILWQQLQVVKWRRCLFQCTTSHILLTFLKMLRVPRTFDSDLTFNWGPSIFLFAPLILQQHLFWLALILFSTSFSQSGRDKSCLCGTMGKTTRR